MTPPCALVYACALLEASNTYKLMRGFNSVGNGDGDDERDDEHAVVLSLARGRRRGGGGGDDVGLRGAAVRMRN